MGHLLVRVDWAGAEARECRPGRAGLVDGQKTGGVVMVVGARGLCLERTTATSHATWREVAHYVEAFSA